MVHCELMGMDNDLHMHMVLSICSHNSAIIHIYVYIIIYHSALNFVF